MRYSVYDSRRCTRHKGGGIQLKGIGGNRPTTMEPRKRDHTSIMAKSSRPVDQHPPSPHSLSRMLWVTSDGAKRSARIARKRFKARSTCRNQARPRKMQMRMQMQMQMQIRIQIQIQIQFVLTFRFPKSRKKRETQPRGRTNFTRSRQRQGAGRRTSTLSRGNRFRWDHGGGEQPQACISPGDSTH